MPGVTKEQIQAAREADLFAWLQSHEPGVLKRDGPNYRHKEHDSLVYVTGKRYWYWNSRGRSINALDYLIQIRGYGLVDAVQALAGGEIRQTPAYQSAAAKQAQREPEKKPFTLPWARRCATAAVSYLQRRGISSDVISRCFRNGLFYEARYHGEPVCVFVGKDNAGKAKFACMRGITGNLKKDVYGSDKEFSFCYPPQNPGSRHVAVFEAPIDALSHGIYNNGELVDTYTTGPDGSFMTRYYVCGDSWTVREIEPSTGYLLNDTVYEVEKCDAETGSIIPMTGTGFQIKDLSTGEFVTQEIFYPNPETLDTFYVSDEGWLMLPEPLHTGDYELYEVAAPYGYVLSSEPVPFTIDGSEAVVTVTQYNMPQKGQTSFSGLA